MLCWLQLAVTKDRLCHYQKWLVCYCYWRYSLKNMKAVTEQVFPQIYIQQNEKGVLFNEFQICWQHLKFEHCRRRTSSYHIPSFLTHQWMKSRKLNIQFGVSYAWYHTKESIEVPIRIKGATSWSSFITKIYIIIESWLTCLYAISSETARCTAAKFCMQMYAVCV